MNRDSLYSQPNKNIGDFVFDEKVANCFDDMITRSVPGYAAIINMIGVLAEQYASNGSCCYDLGCSLGAGILSMQNQLNGRDVTLIGVDNSEAMLKKCKKNLDRAGLHPKAELKCADIRECDIQNAGVVVMNFTLQFVPPDERQDLLQKIYNGLNPDGILVVSEKIIFEHPKEEQFQNELHHTFKKLNGYSDLEIAQKRTALENVLVPDTLGEHRDRLDIVGFKNVNVWFQCFNFVSMTAVK